MTGEQLHFRYLMNLTGELRGREPEWASASDAYRRAWDALAAELNADEHVTDRLLAERNHLLNMDELECGAHGKGCVPGAIQAVKQLASFVRKPEPPPPDHNLEFHGRHDTDASKCACQKFRFNPTGA